jgi:hypothetical protein
MPEVYEFLEAERINDAIRLPANQILQHRIGYLLKRPVGRPSNEVRLAWPNGIQKELSQPVAVLLNEGTDTIAIASRAGYRCFTVLSVPAGSN